MSQTRFFMAPLPAQLGGLIELRGLPQPVEREQDAETDRGLAGRHADGEHGEDLAGQIECW